MPYILGIEPESHRQSPHPELLPYSIRVPGDALHQIIWYLRKLRCAEWGRARHRLPRSFITYQLNKLANGKQQSAKNDKRQPFSAFPEMGWREKATDSGN